MTSLLQTYQQQRFIISKQTKEGSCRTNKWQIEDTYTGKIDCSDLDTNICDKVHPNGIATWTNPTINKDDYIVSTDGLVTCEWDLDKLNEMDINKINKSSSKLNDFEVNDVSKIVCQSDNAKSIQSCYQETISGCPVDIITKKTMKACTVWTAIQNGWKGDSKVGKDTIAKCDACVGGNKMNIGVIDTEITNYCTTGKNEELVKKQDCLCYSPIVEEDKTRKSIRDPVLGKIISPNNILSEGPFTIWDYMKRRYPTLVKNKGLWYVPCNNKEYLAESGIHDGEKKEVCDRLRQFLNDDIVDSTLTDDDRKDLSSRVVCDWFTKLIPKPVPTNDWEKYKWYIIAGVVFFLLIFIIVFSSYY